MRASYDEASGTLSLSVYIHELKFAPADFVDATYEKKADTLVLRVSSMTRYHFEGWEKNAEDPSYAAIRSFVDLCQERLVGDAG
jgi:hypothetical protein